MALLNVPCSEENEWVARSARYRTVGLRLKGLEHSYQRTRRVGWNQCSFFKRLEHHGRRRRGFVFRWEGHGRRKMEWGVLSGGVCVGPSRDLRVNDCVERT